MNRNRIVCFTTLSALVAAFSSPLSAQPKFGKFEPEPAWNKAVDQAVVYLKGAQSPEGTWSAVPSGVTGIVVTGLLKSGKVGPEDPMVAKSLKYIEGLVDPKEGAIAGADARVGSHNYYTCVNIWAFTAADPDGKKYKAIVERGAAYVKKLQFDEGEEKKPSDLIYGGAGYGGGTRPDLSNTHFFLDTLIAAKTPPKDPAFSKAVYFISRCQNFKNEHQDQAWAAKTNDGSFIYTPVTFKGAASEDAPRPGYGSMTYAGIKALLQCGIGKEDPRVKKGLEWVAKNYSVDINPGRADGMGPQGYYYYLLAQAECLTLLGDEFVVDANGKKHNWKLEILTALSARQKKEGNWVNDFPNWMESSPELCTAYALLTLQYVKPPKATP